MGNVWKVAIVKMCLALVTGSDIELHGAGASFPSVVYKKWISLYRQDRLEKNNVIVDISYEAVGSGKGVARVKGEASPPVDFAGSDIPLTPDEQQQYPNLVVFPVIAGTIVIAYNVPEVTGLVLSLDVAVSIYNGSITYWNDSAIVQLNPGKRLPDARVVVVARADESGTTSVITSAFSKVSPEWQSRFGVFSSGYDRETRKPAVWDENAVSFFGHSNNGVSALVSAMYYSIGYVSVSTAVSANLQFAVLQNSAGNDVNATLETVHYAISHANGSFDIINVNGPFAYPLCMFSFMVFPKTTSINCNKAMELVRFINWFFVTPKAAGVAEDAHLVPIDNKTVEFITKNVLHAITCNDLNVWQLIEEQFALERQPVPEKENWQTTVSVTIACLVGVTLLLCFVFGRQQYKIHKELIKDTWKIPVRNLDLFINHMVSPDANRSQHSSNQTNSVHMHFGQQAWDDNRILSGKYGDTIVTLVQIENQSLDFSLRGRKTILWMRDSIRNANLFSLEGLTEICHKWYTVHSSSSRGTLSDIFSDKKFTFHTSGRVSLVKDLISALAYLHKKSIVHGKLTSRYCFIDVNWNLKVAGWCDHMLTKTKQNMNHERIESFTYTVDDDMAASLLWTAPEVIKYHRDPTFSSDVYSLSMVIQEIFTGKAPFSELSITPSEIIYAVITCGITPRIYNDTPDILKSIMERSWHFDPSARPTMHSIDGSMAKAFPKSASFIDCMTSTLEQYAASLEEKIKAYDLEKKKLQEQMDKYLNYNIPSYFVQQFHNGKPSGTLVVDDVCIIACAVAKTGHLLGTMTPSGFVNFLNHFYNGIDQLLLQDDLHRLSRSAGEFSYAFGSLSTLDIPYKVETQVGTAARIATKIRMFSDKFGTERLVGIDTTFKLRIGLAVGPVAAGILKTGICTFMMFGKAIDNAASLCRTCEDGCIRIDSTCFTILKGSKTPVLQKGCGHYELDLSNK